MDLREIEWGGTYWFHLAHDRGHGQALVNTVIKLRVWKILEYLSDWGLPKDSAPWSELD
jgi:hypothetical protein